MNPSTFQLPDSTNVRTDLKIQKVVLEVEAENLRHPKGNRSNEFIRLVLRKARNKIKASKIIGREALQV